MKFSTLIKHLIGYTTLVLLWDVLVLLWGCTGVVMGCTGIVRKMCTGRSMLMIVSEFDLYEGVSKGL